MRNYDTQLWLFFSSFLLLGDGLNAIIVSERLPIHLFPMVAANWSACPVLSDGTVSVNNVFAQCMMIHVPIDWNEKNVSNIQTNTLQVFVKRYFLLGTQNTSHHLWRVPGGGGIPISTLEFEAISVVSALNGSVSIYATDKRSVGQSSLLECPTSIVANLSACIPFIQQNQYRLKHNTYTNTARDLQYLLRVVAGQRSFSSPSSFKPRVAIMGSSQGTYLLQRYLHLMEDNEPVDAVILDSVLPSDITRLPYGDRYLNYVFLDLFTRCTQDYDGCARHFEENNPLRALYTYSINADIGNDSSCLTQMNTSAVEIGKKMSYLFYPGTMELFPALIHRINRCNTEDQKVLARFIQQTKAPDEDGSPGFSILVELNNNLAELWSAYNNAEPNETLSCNRLKGMSDNTFSATHVMPDIYCPIEVTGILGYPTDQYYRKYPQDKPAFPVLLLHGDMDQALPVPISRHFYKEYSKVNSKLIYVELPRTGHTATNASPMPNRSDTCGWNVAISFMLSPNFQPDTSCLTEINAIDFAGSTKTTKDVALHYFGTDDIWGADC